MENFFGEYFSDKKKVAKPQVIDALYRVPRKDKGVNVPHFQVLAPNYVHQADLLFLPDDDGYKFALVVVDANSRITDAEPLKSKSAEAVLDAFKLIYSRKILKVPKRLEVDPGAEFKSSVAQYFKDQGVHVRVGKTGRHRQQSLVERRNQIIGTAIAKKQAAQELITEEPATDWTEDLPLIIKAMNAKTKRAKIKLKAPKDPVCDGESCHLLDIDAKVRAVLEQPRDVAQGKRLHGKFRSGDIRWNPQERIIKEVILKPGYPPLYLLDGKVGPRLIDPTAYTRNQLQIISEDEEFPSNKIIRNPEKIKKYLVQKILEKKKIKNKWFYLIKWRGYSTAEATWEPVKNIKEDQPEVATAYEQSIK